MDAICCLKLLVPHCLLLLGNAPAAAIITTKSLLSHCNLASSLRPTLWTLRRRRGVALLFFIFVKSAVHMRLGVHLPIPGTKSCCPRASKVSLFADTSPITSKHTVVGVNINKNVFCAPCNAQCAKVLRKLALSIGKSYCISPVCEFFTPGMITCDPLGQNDLFFFS